MTKIGWPSGPSEELPAVPRLRTVLSKKKKELCFDPDLKINVSSAFTRLKSFDSDLKTNVSSSAFTILPEKAGAPYKLF